jgi:hypothetical protein
LYHNTPWVLLQLLGLNPRITPAQEFGVLPGDLTTLEIFVALWWLRASASVLPLVKETQIWG